VTIKVICGTGAYGVRLHSWDWQLTGVAFIINGFSLQDKKNTETNNKND